MILKFEVYVTLGSYQTIKQQLYDTITEIQNATNAQTDEIKIILKEE
jgi:hypothetical protein